MKKIARILALTLTVALLAVSLCSCQLVDDLRARQAFFNNDEHSEILYNGKTYKGIVGNNRALADQSGYYRTTVNVTEKDVPVLLSETLGSSVYINKEETVMMNLGIYSYGDDWTSSNKTTKYDYFVVENEYDKYAALFDTKNPLDKYMVMVNDYEYMTYTYDDMDIFERNESEPYQPSYKKELLSDELSAQIEKAENADKKDKVATKDLKGNLRDIQRISEIYKCDESMSVYESDRKYNSELVYDGSDYYVWVEDDYADNNDFYKLPDSLKTYMDKLFKDYSNYFTSFDIEEYYNSFEYDS